VEGAGFLIDEARSDNPDSVEMEMINWYYGD
jgi:hypothetical protein